MRILQVMSNDTEKESLRMNEYIVYKDVEIEYQVGKEIRKIRGNILVAQGGHYLDFCIINTGQESSTCIAWSNIITMKSIIPDMFLKSFARIKENKQKHELSMQMQDADFYKELEMSKEGTSSINFQ